MTGSWRLDLGGFVCAGSSASTVSFRAGSILVLGVWLSSLINEHTDRGCSLSLPYKTSTMPPTGFAPKGLQEWSGRPWQERVNLM